MTLFQNTVPSYQNGMSHNHNTLISKLNSINSILQNQLQQKCFFYVRKLFESFQPVTINGYENYSTAILGKINILLTAPHGGWDRPKMIAKRTKLFYRKLAMRFVTFNQRKFAAIVQRKTKH